MFSVQGDTRNRAEFILKSAGGDDIVSVHLIHTPRLCLPGFDFHHVDVTPVCLGDKRDHR